MLARRFLLGGNGGVFVPGEELPPEEEPPPGDTPEVFTVAASPNGGWTMMNEPKAVYASGKVHLGWIDGSSGACEVATWDIAGATLTTPFNLRTLGTDTHNAPAVLVRSSDSKLLTVYMGHDAANVFRRISTNANDASAWGAEGDITASLSGSGDYTYPQLHQLDSGTIYLFLRDLSGSTGRISYSTSSDGGSTWSALTHLFTGAVGAIPYWRVGNDGTRLHIATSNTSPYDAVSAMGHFYLEGGTRKASDGSTISASLPLVFADITQVQSNAAGSVWPWGVSMDGSTPYIISMTDLGSDNSIRRHAFSGSWSGTEITKSDGQHAGDKFGGGCNIHQSDPTRAYVAKKVSGHYVMYRYVLDGSWTGTQIGTVGTPEEWSPQFVLDGTGDFEGMYARGTFTGPTSYALGVIGVRLT